jgi:hypothetical protein
MQPHSTSLTSSPSLLRHPPPRPSPDTPVIASLFAPMSASLNGQAQGRTAALVRQISNPMAGVDTTLLALAGCGDQRQRRGQGQGPNSAGVGTGVEAGGGSSSSGAAFGFMSCDRTIGAAEGCNVLQERRITDGEMGGWVAGACWPTGE